MADPISRIGGAKTIETFDGFEIVFTGEAWVNAAHMAQAFNARTNDFLRTASAQAFIAELEKTIAGKCVVVQNGGIAPGTWMHPDLALEFARWLSPKFAIWTNQISRRVLAGGQATTDNATVLNLMGRIVERLERLEAGSKPARAPRSAPSAPRTLSPSHADLLKLIDEVLFANPAGGDWWVGTAEHLRERFEDAGQGIYGYLRLNSLARQHPDRCLSLRSLARGKLRAYVLHRAGCSDLDAIDWALVRRQLQALLSGAEAMLPGADDLGLFRKPSPCTTCPSRKEGGT